ncbi:hypothetical protein COV61_04465 [Candidatus Micrarchaeota archaeon CG11_big_fil_rev_8_21_14_0_20_47_5]|nr:MAG: hypothetical protein AUJ17_05300 [Candidatus Micrarchaeota archaeon CG1_02_47_40]PIN82978.1 MAG: hypothetical protein COV61_04465 [Candidatus Micrarchaeota archaeon CG11_big_fil_rev_8_21_14_0_20_47_5]
MTAKITVKFGRYGGTGITFPVPEYIARAFAKKEPLAGEALKRREDVRRLFRWVEKGEPERIVMRKYKLLAGIDKTEEVSVSFEIPPEARLREGQEELTLGKTIKNSEITKEVFQKAKQARIKAYTLGWSPEGIRYHIAREAQGPIMVLTLQELSNLCDARKNQGEAN